MKLSKRYLGLVAALAAGAFVLTTTLAQQGGQAPAQTRVAVCDVVQVFNNYKRSQDLSAELSKEREQTKAEGERRAKEIRALQMELEALKQGSPEYDKRLEEVQRRSIELKTWSEFQDQLILRKHRRLTQDLYKQILKVIEAVAKERGFQLVIYAQSGEIMGNTTQDVLRMIELRKVLYAADGLDLTDTVLARLNQGYRP